MAIQGVFLKGEFKPFAHYDYCNPIQIRGNLYPLPSKKEEEPSSSKSKQKASQGKKYIEQFEGNDMHVAMQFTNITRESDVRFFTGLESPEKLCELFSFLLPKLAIMTF